MSTRKTTLFYAVLIAVASLAVGMVIASQLDLTPASSAQTVAVPRDEQRAARRRDRRATFRNIAKAQVPTVVNIHDVRPAARPGPDRLLGGDDLLRRFFGGQLPPQGQGQGQGRNPRGRQRPQR